MLPDEADMLSRMWFPVARIRDLDAGPFGATLLDRNLVVYRTAAGVAVAHDAGARRSLRGVLGDPLPAKRLGDQAVE